jgi:hypothetical protein
MEVIALSVREKVEIVAEDDEEPLDEELLAEVEPDKVGRSERRKFVNKAELKSLVVREETGGTVGVRVGGALMLRSWRSII